MELDYFGLWKLAFWILDTRFWMLVWGSLFGRQRRLSYWVLNSGPYFDGNGLQTTDPPSAERKASCKLVLSGVEGLSSVLLGTPKP